MSLLFMTGYDRIVVGGGGELVFISYFDLSICTAGEMFYKTTGKLCRSRSDCCVRAI